jgi:hypothetical protein
MKTCSLCGIEKPRYEYTKKRRNSDGLMAMCRECSLPRRREQYEANPQNQRDAVNERRAEVRERIATYKIENPCTDCGKHYPSYVMDFDHVRGEKRAGVAQLTTHSWDVIQAEIDKCDLVCANCHRERTFMRLGSTQLDYYHEDYQLD